MQQNAVSSNVRRSLLAAATVGLLLSPAIGMTIAAGSTAKSSFSFKLARAPKLSSCLPRAAASVQITSTPPNDTMKVSISGVPANNDFALFAIQGPLAPFGVAYYETELHTGSTGSGSATVRGAFNADAFAVSNGGTVTFAPTHLYHLGIWFANPEVPFNLGCEAGATSPIVTPFGPSQHAGVQVLTSSNYPANAGPLSHVKK